MRRRLVWDLVFVGAAVLVGLALSFKPWRVFFDLRREAVRNVAEMNDAEARRAELARKKAKLETPVGREELAREHGFVLPGERPAEGGK